MHREEKKREIRFGPGGYGELKNVSSSMVQRGKGNIARHKVGRSVDTFVGAKTKPYLMYDSALQEASRGKYVGFTVPPRLKSGATRRPYLKEKETRSNTTPKSKTRKRRGIGAFTKRWGKSKGGQEHEVALELDSICQAKKKLRTKKKTESLPSLDRFPPLHSSNRSKLQPLNPLASKCSWTMPDFDAPDADPLGLLLMEEEEEEKEEGKPYCLYPHDTVFSMLLHRIFGPNFEELSAFNHCAVQCSRHEFGRSTSRRAHRR
jgi:hypothetical protein